MRNNDAKGLHEETPKRINPTEGRGAHKKTNLKYEWEKFIQIYCYRRKRYTLAKFQERYILFSMISNSSIKNS